MWLKNQIKIITLNSNVINLKSSDIWYSQNMMIHCEKFWLPFKNSKLVLTLAEWPATKQGESTSGPVGFRAAYKSEVYSRSLFFFFLQLRSPPPTHPPGMPGHKSKKLCWNAILGSAVPNFRWSPGSNCRSKTSNPPPPTPVLCFFIVLTLEPLAETLFLLFHQ